MITIKVLDFKISEYSKDDKIIIYGAAIGGKIISHLLKINNIPVEFLCDRAVTELENEGISIYHPNKIFEYIKTPNVKIIISVTRSFDSVIQFLEKIGFDQVYHGVSLMQFLSVEEKQKMQLEPNEIEEFILKYGYYVTSKKNDVIVLQSLEVFLTTRCTLRCKDCSHLIPYYEHQIDYSYELIQLYLERMFETVDEIIELILLGGEPFLYDNLGNLLMWIAGKKKNKIITVITNGTIIPSDEILNILKETNTRIRISDYGEYSTKIDKLETVFISKKINYYINRELWTDMGDMIKHNYNTEQLQEIFKDCPFAYDFLLLGSRFYRCAHVGHLHNLKLIKDVEDDYVDFAGKEFSPSIARNRFREYLKQNLLYGCMYCNGVNSNNGKVYPGTQISKVELLNKKANINR